MDNQRPTNPPAGTGGSGPASRPERPAGDRPRYERNDRGGGQGERGGRRFGPPMRRFCAFCKDPNKHIDYKNGDALRRYLTERGKIRARRKIGTCARHQRQLALAIKRARHLALLPYSPEHLRGG